MAIVGVWEKSLGRCRDSNRRRAVSPDALTRQAVMEGDVVQAMKLANELDPTMLDADR